MVFSQILGILKKIYLFTTDDLTDIEVDLEESAGSDNYSVEDSDESDVNNDDALQLNEQRQRVLSKEFWKKVTMETVERIPHDIDKYSVQSNSRISLLGKCSDGRPWNLTQEHTGLATRAPDTEIVEAH